MKTGLLILCTLLAATVSFGQTNTNDAIVGGIVITTPPELSQRPSCNASTQNFIFVDYSNGQSTVCRSGSWVNLAVDVDGDGITAALDANDADASDLGDSDLTAENIKQGVVIFDGKASEITGTATTTPVVDGSSFSITPATTPSASEQTARRTVPAGTYDGTEEVTHVVRGDSDLAGNNIRGGVDIFGVTGSLTEKGGFSISKTTPSTSDKTARRTVPAGVYDGDEEVTHVVAGDADLLASNIKDGVTIFGVEGSLETSPTVDGSDFSISATTPSASEQTARRNVPAGTYDGTEEVTHVVAGDADLAGNNIRGGVDIFGVTGSLTEKGGFSISKTTPGTSDKTARRTVPAGVYDGDEEVTHVVAGDADLAGNNIRGGVDIFGVTGSLTEKGNFSISKTTPGTSDKTARRTVPAGVYDGDEEVTHVVAGDADLLASNIKDGVTIFGVEGTVTSGSSSTYTYTTINAGYNSHDDYVLSGGTTSADAYCVARGYHEHSSYSKNLVGQKGIQVVWSSSDNRFIVTSGTGGGYGGYNSITCKRYSID